MRGSRFLVVSSFLAVAVIVFAAPPASALTPQRVHFSFSDSHTFPAGTLCDFTYHQSFSVSGFDVMFLNNGGDVVRNQMHLVATVTHTNKVTGYFLTETDVENSTTYGPANFGRTVGIQWHLRNSDGKIVLTVSGLLTYHLDPFQIISITPRLAKFFDFPEVICPLLGGHPA
jgi:hypothetical protein